MGWLVITKIAPSYWVGEPPSYQTILENELEKPVGWTMWFNDKQMGWAISSVVVSEDADYLPKVSTKLEKSPKEIRCQIHFDDLPIQELSSGLGRSLYQLLLQPPGKIEMDVKSTLTIDALGRLVRFDSRVELESLQKMVHLLGTVNGGRMHMELRSGEFSYSNDITLPQHALLSDSLSPQMRLPNLALGQTWTVPIVSPLRPVGNMMEILHAVVERKEPLYWNGEIQNAWVVVYREDPGLSLGENSNKRGTAWVLEDGTVIRQQAMIFDSKLSFVRMAEPETKLLIKQNREQAERKEKAADNELQE